MIPGVLGPGDGTGVYDEEPLSPNQEFDSNEDTKPGLTLKVKRKRLNAQRQVLSCTECKRVT